MKLTWADETPRKIQRFAGSDRLKGTAGDIDDRLTASDVDHVAEIFQTPLTGGVCLVVCVIFLILVTPMSPVLRGHPPAASPAYASAPE